MLSVYPSVTLMCRGHIVWVCSKAIIRIISVASSLLKHFCKIYATKTVYLQYTWSKMEKLLNLYHSGSELDMDWFHPWIVLDWIGLDWVQFLVVSAYRYIAITTLAIIAVFLEYLRQFLIDLHHIYRHSIVCQKTRHRAFFQLFSSSSFRARRRRDFFVTLCVSRCSESLDCLTLS